MSGRIRVRRVVLGDETDQAAAPQASSDAHESRMRRHVPARQGRRPELAWSDVELCGQHRGSAGAHDEGHQKSRDSHLYLEHFLVVLWARGELAQRLLP